MAQPVFISRSMLFAVSLLLLHADVLAAPQLAESAGQRPAGDATAVFLREHCERCHAVSEPAGTFRLPAQTLSQSQQADFGLWLQVRNQLRHGTMPPVAEPQPEPQQRTSGRRNQSVAG